jgi:hypothetical protein
MIIIQERQPHDISTRSQNGKTGAGALWWRSRIGLKLFFRDDFGSDAD